MSKVGRGDKRIVGKFENY